MSQIPATEQYIAARLCEGSTPRGWRAIADALDAAARTLAAAIPAGAHHPDSQAALDARRVGNLTAAAPPLATPSSTLAGRCSAAATRAPPRRCSRRAAPPDPTHTPDRIEAGYFGRFRTPHE